MKLRFATLAMVILGALASAKLLADVPAQTDQWCGSHGNPPENNQCPVGGCYVNYIDGVPVSAKKYIASSITYKSCEVHADWSCTDHLDHTVSCPYQLWDRYCKRILDDTTWTQDQIVCYSEESPQNN